MLLCDMDPTTQEFINDSVIQKKEIKEVFEYLSGILKELIQNKTGDVVTTLIHKFAEMKNPL